MYRDLPQASINQQASESAFVATHYWIWLQFQQSSIVDYDPLVIEPVRHSTANCKSMIVLYHFLMTKIFFESFIIY